MGTKTVLKTESFAFFDNSRFMTSDSNIGAVIRIL